MKNTIATLDKYCYNKSYHLEMAFDYSKEDEQVCCVRIYRKRGDFVPLVSKVAFTIEDCIEGVFEDINAI